MQGQPCLQGSGGELLLGSSTSTPSQKPSLELSFSSQRLSGKHLQALRSSMDNLSEQGWWNNLSLFPRVVHDNYTTDFLQPRYPQSVSLLLFAHISYPKSNLGWGFQMASIHPKENRVNSWGEATGVLVLMYPKLHCDLYLSLSPF